MLMLVHFSRGQKCHKQQQKEFRTSQKLIYFYSENVISLVRPEHFSPNNDGGGVKEDPTWKREK